MSCIHPCSKWELAGPPVVTQPFTAPTLIRDSGIEAAPPMHPSRQYLFKTLPASLLILFICAPVRAAEIPGARLPPPASAVVDFDRDISPILEQSCLRCHGPERPKSHFRLDNRASALKGGREGIDIIPGDSGKSPLIRYVAGADDEIKMPPPGKGNLTDEQI